MKDSQKSLAKFMHRDGGIYELTAVANISAEPPQGDLELVDIGHCYSTDNNHQQIAIMVDDGGFLWACHGSEFNNTGLERFSVAMIVFKNVADKTVWCFPLSNWSNNLMVVDSELPGNVTCH